MHVGRARWQVKVSFTVLLLQQYFCAYQASSLEEIHSSDVHNAPFGTGKRHLEAFQLPSLQSWLASKSVRAVLAFRQKVSMNSHVTKQLQATVPVTLLQFRPSESSFASLHSLFVSALTCRRLSHPHPCLHRQFVMDQQLSGCGVERVQQRSRVLKANNSAGVHGRKRSTATHTGTESQITQHVRDYVSPRPFHCSSLVLLCNARQCLQLGRIQPRVRPFAKQHV